MLDNSNFDEVRKLKDDSGVDDQSQSPEKTNVLDIGDDFVLLPDKEVKTLHGGWNYLEVSMNIPYKEVQLLPSRIQANVNGLVNVGWSCYVNVILQCLANTPGIKEYFLADLHRREFLSYSVPGNDPLSCKLPKEPENLSYRVGEFIQYYHSYNDHVLKAEKIIEMITCDSKKFKPASQVADAHEFMVYMMEMLSNELNRYSALT